MSTNSIKLSAKTAFQRIGTVCATRSCEIMFCIITSIILMISHIDWQNNTSTKTVHPDYHGIDVLFMTILRCSTILYLYHQFHSLSKDGSRYLFSIAGLYVVSSCFIFCCCILRLLNCNISDLKDAIFFFLLLTDLRKVNFMAGSALQGHSYTDVQSRLAEGLAHLGPSLTLDTVFEILLVGAGTLSGVDRVKQMCGYAIMSILVNYCLLISFFPSCLSFFLELSHRHASTESRWWMSAGESRHDTKRKTNPILQSVKGIMSAGLFLIHVSHWSFDSVRRRLSGLDGLELVNTDPVSHNASADPHSTPPLLIQWLNAGIDNAVFMVIVVVLMVKYAFFESFWSIESTMHTKEHKKVEISTQTDQQKCENENDRPTESSEPRSLKECLVISQTKNGFDVLSDAEVLSLVCENAVPARSLERCLKDSLRAVKIRRGFVRSRLRCPPIDQLPYENYDYDKVLGTCCENVIGFVPVPVGVAGPIKVNGREYMIPLATTEGALVASTSRGCKAISESPGGAVSFVYNDAMSRGPVVELPSAQKAVEVQQWVQTKANFGVVAQAFNSTSSFARLADIHVFVAARHLYLRFEASTGDAMGMNMVAKGTEAALIAMKKFFPEMKVVSISGNVCTDKKPSSINWILGRGKSVVAEVTVPGAVVRSVLKTSAGTLVEANIRKNLIGSAVAGSIGGNNAHAANIIAALFIACGQDPAQVVGSSSCLTVMERKGATGEDLYVAVTMPCVEVGTVGGGTSLAAQAACLNLLGVKGPSKDNPGENASRLATVVASTVMAGELSLMASLAEQTLVKSHMALNRPNGKPSVSSPNNPN